MTDTLSFFLLTVISSAIGTITGFGTSTIMVPVLSLFFPIPITLLFVGILHWFGDIWKILFFKKGVNMRLILLFGVPGIIASSLAARLPLALPEVLLERLLGAFLVVYVTFLFVKPDWKLKASNAHALWGGTLSGFFAGIFGVGGAVRSTFLTAFDLPKSVFIFTSGVIGIMIDSARLAQYIGSGIRIPSNLLITLILCIPASLLGAYGAKHLVHRIPQKAFRAVVALALLLVGLRYLLF